MATVGLGNFVEYLSAKNSYLWKIHVTMFDYYKFMGTWNIHHVLL